MSRPTDTRDSKVVMPPNQRNLDAASHENDGASSDESKTTDGARNPSGQDGENMLAQDA